MLIWTLFLQTTDTTTHKKLNNLKMYAFLSRFQVMKESKLEKKISNDFLNNHVNSNVENMHEFFLLDNMTGERKTLRREVSLRRSVGSIKLHFKLRGKLFT